MGLHSFTKTSLLFCLVIWLSACNQEKNETRIFGKYKAYSDDPAVRQFIAAEDNYLKLAEDQSIVYHTTINGKPKFHIKGNFTLADSTLHITWDSGRLPKQLVIEEKNERQLIRIGQTLYLKEKGQ